MLEATHRLQLDAFLVKLWFLLQYSAVVSDIMDSLARIAWNVLAVKFTERNSNVVMYCAQMIAFREHRHEYGLDKCPMQVHKT